MTDAQRPFITWFTDNTTELHSSANNSMVIANSLM